MSGFSQLNVWVALEDLTGFPLSFIRSNSIDVEKMKNAKSKKGKRTFDHDPGHDVVLIPDMKKGQMIIFDGCSVVHGTPRLVKSGGSRDSLVATFRVRKY
jgi:hypothetical protein